MSVVWVMDVGQQDMARVVHISIKLPIRGQDARLHHVAEYVNAFILSQWDAVSLSLAENNKMYVRKRFFKGKPTSLTTPEWMAS